MPITLITGLPGHGKTLYALSRYKGEAEAAGRPVFHASGVAEGGIPGLALAWQAWDAREWFKLPAGALMVIDECQRVFPIRGRGADVPEHVRQLETHRHLGLDIVLITQDPLLLDTHVRRLVDRHFHVVRKFGTHFATIHEYVNGARDSVAKSRGDSIRHEWRYPKEAFDWYRSAEVHTVKRRIPWRVWLMLLVPVVVLAAVWFFIERTRGRIDGEVGGGSMAHAPAETRGAPGQRAYGAGGQSQGPTYLDARQWAAMQQPRVPDLAYTAPAFDEVTKPVRAPYPAACIASAARCQCYTQQGTKLQTGDAMCRGIADGGFFVAWSEEPVRAVPAGVEARSVAAPAPEAPPVVLASPGPVAAGSLGGARSAPPPPPEPAPAPAQNPHRSLNTTRPS